MPQRVQLRRLTRPEREMLRKKLRDLSLSVRIHQRYRVIDEVHRGREPLDAADRIGCHFSVAYDWIRRFNESGFHTFERVPNPKGRPPLLEAEQLRLLIEIARSHPSEHGLPYSRWSVAKLAAYCRGKGLLPEVSDEWVRRLLRREGVRLRRGGRTSGEAVSSARHSARRSGGAGRGPRRRSTRSKKDGPSK